jgi:hypothetical protein
LSVSKYLVPHPSAIVVLVVDARHGERRCPGVWLVPGAFRGRPNESPSCWSVRDVGDHAPCRGIKATDPMICSFQHLLGETRTVPARSSQMRSDPPASHVAIGSLGYNNQREIRVSHSPCAARRRHRDGSVRIHGLITLTKCLKVICLPSTVLKTHVEPAPK